jgi:oxalate decarboxylase/phosphoglucose isomerase-like protein (cupin superfamily)
MSHKQPIVHHRDETPPIECPFGHVQRIITGGEGGVANVHVVKITKGTPHLHQGYDEVYYVLTGTGTITMGQEMHPLRPGSVSVVSIDLCRIKSCRVAGFTRDAQRVPKDRRRSWALTRRTAY